MSTEPFVEVLMTDDGQLVRPGYIGLQCPKCRHVTMKRKDHFLPGAHSIICANFSPTGERGALRAVCGNTSSAVILSNGELRKITSATRSGGGA